SCFTFTFKSFAFESPFIAVIDLHVVMFFSLVDSQREFSHHQYCFRLRRIFSKVLLLTSRANVEGPRHVKRSVQLSQWSTCKKMQRDRTIHVLGIPWFLSLILCVCHSGYAGQSCSDETCPGKCSNRGRCIDGECVCDDGFNGPDCAEKTCPTDCSDRGRCINGKCVCDSGFAGDDCSESSCPGNCNDRGRCVDGQCVCDHGFTGADCSERACPNNCSSRGMCVKGKCVCDVGFAGPGCKAKSCPNNCNNKGRCIKGRCVCRRGFTGPDCNESTAAFIELFSLQCFSCIKSPVSVSKRCIQKSQTSDS
uniref:EGF-like domain-containing protein n=1 Tax=Mola mola TaxID=94237 RepID=A0A3Q3XGP7_MOLML